MVWVRKIEKRITRIRHSLHERMDGCRREYDGGPGSGNWGHAGRPGEVGGSKESGGRHNRQKDKKGAFTSFTKKRKEAATMHGLTNSDIELLQSPHAKDVRIVDKDGNRYQYSGLGKFKDVVTGKEKQFSTGEQARIILPNSMNPNYAITKDDREAMKKGTSDFSSALNTGAKKVIDNKYRAVTGKIWKECSEAEKHALYSYTTSAHDDINYALRKGNTDDASMNKRIDRITEALDKSELKEDTILHRGMSKSAAEKMFGLPEGYLSRANHMDPSNISLVGRVGTDDGFMSTGAAKGTGFGGSVHVEIMAPKGTKGLYMEPFSMYGEGDGLGWDGESKQKKFGGEFEILLQRGCTLQIIEHTTEGGGHNIKAVILRQDASASAYAQKRKAAKEEKPRKTA